jgi:ParB-like chromosome segregation protein Spo0J
MKKKAKPNGTVAPTTGIRAKHPIDGVEWVDPTTLHSNSYNPNVVFTPEMLALALSIIEDGWTHPVLVTYEGEIVDGFHRWTLALKHPDVRRVSGGLVPIVRYRQGATRADQMIATVRHNRARGQHGIVAMAGIVRELVKQGLTDDEIERRLGMEDEERERLADMRGSPDKAGKDSFGKGWVPFRAGNSEPPAGG